MINVTFGDCLEVMDELIAQGVKVDAIITDPPYGTTACKWDSVIPMDAMWERLNKLIKPSGAIVLFGSQPFTSSLIMSNLKMYKQILVFEKTRPSNVMNAKKMFMKWHEDIVIFYNKLPTYNPQKTKADRIVKVQRIQDRSKGHMGRTGEKDGYIHDNGGESYPKTILKFKENRGLHPTQKPVPLMEYLIKTYTNENETVLDFTMGSGSTGVACVNTDRKFIGIELDPNYFYIAVERIDNAMRLRA